MSEPFLTIKTREEIHDQLDEDGIFEHPTKNKPQRLVCVAVAAVICIAFAVIVYAAPHPLLLTPNP